MMHISKHLFFVLTLLVFIGCKPNIDGTYTVYQVSRTSSERGFGMNFSNDTISSYLKTKLKGAKIDVKFKEQYVELHNKDASEPIVLPKEDNGAGYIIYKDSEKLGVRTYHFKLKELKNDELILEVVLVCPNDNALIFPIQLGESEYGASKDKFGIAVCYLSKSN